MLDRDEAHLSTMQDQCRRGDACQGVAYVGVDHHLGRRASHAGRGGPVAGEIPPRPKRLIVRNARRDGAQDVEALLDRVRLDPDRHERTGAAQPHFA